MADAPASSRAERHAAPYREVTLRDYCRAHDQPFVQVAAHRVINRMQRPIPGWHDDRLMLTRVETPEIFLGRVQEARVIGVLGFVCTKNGFMIRKQLRQADERKQEDLDASIVGRDSEGRHLIVMPDRDVTVDRECVFVGGEVNFGHLLIETLARLAVMRRFPQLNQLPIVVFDDLPARFLDFIALLGFDSSQRISIPRSSSTVFSTVWFLSAPNYRPQPSARAQLWPDAVWDLRAQFAKLFRPFEPKRPRLYLARGKTKWRRLINEAALQQQLSALGVDIVQLDQLSAADQIATVSNPQLIVTPQGASTQITQFAPSDCIVIELTAPGAAFVFGPYVTSAILDQPFTRVSGRFATPADVEAAGLPPNPSTKSTDADYLIPEEALTPVLTAALAALDGPRK
jgi:capsular polysaccharide biosynthesis protein